MSRLSRERQARVLFSPSGKHGQFATGTTVLQAARELGVDIDSICGGRGLCGRCQVEAVEGNFAREGIHSSPEHLSDLTEDERQCQRDGQLRGNSRLSCCATILEDV